MKPSTKTVQDLLAQIVDLKRELANLRAFSDQVQPLFNIWSCVKCGSIKRFKAEALTKPIICEICNIQMRPHIIQQYHNLREQFEKLDANYSAAIVERNKYANIIQQLIPILKENGYTSLDNDVVSYIKSQFQYLKKLEELIANSQHSSNLE